MTGRIFDIQRYSLHDGSGIRTIVFFMGCFLRCSWCCNPESQDFHGNANGKAREYTIDEIMKEVERDRPYYRRSGGGLTLSGGEILVQPDFARALLKTAKENGIHTAVETTALAPFSEVEKILPYVDTFLMDIKHTNQIKHKEFTGVPNDLAPENAAKIAGTNQTELIIRVPVIPGFNASEYEISEIANFAATLPGVKEIHLLPYHRYGEGKYAALGRKYPMGDTEPPSPTEMETLKKAASNAAKQMTIRSEGSW